MQLNIGTTIDLDSLINNRLLIQAGSGGGKSFLLRKLIESVGSSCQQIILDPEGEFFTLMEKFDFARVAKGGDIPLNLKYAETLAHKLLETRLSAVIDLYELKQHERILFVKRFLDALINAPKDLWHPCLVYVDEAHIFCPESSKSESMSSVIDLCTRGRKRGFAAVLATQRLSKLHKDAAAECNNKMIGRTGLDIDRKRAGDELGMISKADMISLRDLQPGEFYAFGPAISHEVIKFKVSPVITTHLAAGKKAINVPPTPGAIKRILSKLQDIPEEAEKDLLSKQQLQAEVTRLRTELTKSKTVSPVQKVDVAPLHNEILKLKDQIKESAAQVQQFQKVAKEQENKINKAMAIFGKEGTTKIPYIIPIAAVDVRVPLPVRRTEVATTPVKQLQISADASDYKPGKCAASIAGFLAAYPDRSFSKAQVAIATGYSVGSGGFNNSLAELNARGFILRDNSRLKINPTVSFAGLQAYTPGEHPSKTYATKLGKCEREIYEVLLAYPNDTFNKVDLADYTPSKYSPGSGGFNNALSTLNTLELIKRENGLIRLNPELLEI